MHTKIFLYLLLIILISIPSCVTTHFVDEIGNINGYYWDAEKENFALGNNVEEIQKKVEERVAQIYTSDLEYVTANYEPIKDYDSIFTHNKFQQSIEQKNRWRYWQNDTKNKITIEIIAKKEKQKISVQQDKQTLRYNYFGYPLYILTPFTIAIDIVIFPANIYYFIIISSFPRLG